MNKNKTIIQILFILAALLLCQNIFAQDEMEESQTESEYSAESTEEAVDESSVESEELSEPVSASEESDYVGASPFASMGEAENLAMGVSNRNIRKIIKKKLDENPTDGNSLAVLAELMRRVGHPQAEEYFEKAIAAKPKEPGYHMWYGRYLWYRGLNYRAEKQFFEGLRKVRARKAAGFALKDDPFLEQWLERGLINNFQDFGLPLTRHKGYPYKNADGDKKPGLFLLGGLNVGKQPVDFDLLDNHTIQFTGLLGFFRQGAFEGRGNDLTITNDVVKGICRSPFRLNTDARARFYTPNNIMPAIDVRFGFNQSKESQYFQRFKPDTFVNTQTIKVGGGLTKSYSIGNLFDLKVDLGYNLLRRKGQIEFKADTFENVNMYEGRVEFSRFISSNKLSLSFFNVLLDIPEYDITSPGMERRAKNVKGAMIDFAMYGAIPLPAIEYGKFKFKRKNTRGFHFFGGYMMDDEVWNPEHRIDNFLLAGSHLKGVVDGRMDFSFFPMWFFGDTEIAGKDSTIFGWPSRENKLLRWNLLQRFRIIDEERTPWLPKEWNNFLRPASLDLTVPIYIEHAYGNTDETYENWGFGIELWSKLISKSLGGTTFLCTALYQFQNYWQIEKNLHNFRFDIRMGWGRI